MNNNNKESTDDELADRLKKLLSKRDSSSAKESDEELAKRFNKIFSVEPISSQKNLNYQLPEKVYTDDIEKEIELMFQEGSDEDKDSIDDYIYNILKKSDTKHTKDTSINTLQEKMDGFHKLFMGSLSSDLETGSEESDALIRKLQMENALDVKYESIVKKRDEDFEKRLSALKKNAPELSSDGQVDSSNGSISSSFSGKPKGSIPKPLLDEDIYDEMDDWCCICNEDATITCDDCQDDNNYCKGCFFYTHRSDSADYEALKHMSRKKEKRRQT